MKNRSILKTVSLIAASSFKLGLALMTATHLYVPASETLAEAILKVLSPDAS